MYFNVLTYTVVPTMLPAQHSVTDIYCTGSDCTANTALCDWYLLHR